MENTTNQKTEKPLENFRAGDVQAAVWERDGKNGGYVNTTFSRSYMDNGEVKNSYSFSGQQLVDLQRVAKDAYEFEKDYKKEKGNEALDRFDARNNEQSHEDQEHDLGH